MAICERCGKEFDEENDCEEFEIETTLCYEKLAMTLCTECAIDAIDAMEDGIYFERCAECGKSYDLIAEDAEFELKYGEKPETLFENFLCYDCAEDAYEKFQEEIHDDDWMDDDNDNDDDESLNVYDAAIIWASHGKDEDYMFGYSEEELEDAL